MSTLQTTIPVVRDDEGDLMAQTCYIPKKFTPEHRRIIDVANQICDDYDRMGLVLTLRQLYYQFVQRGLLPNQQSKYKRLGDICRDARLAGEMDWDYLIDRTRNLLDRRHWESPADMVKWASDQFHTDLWKPQRRRVEVWVEKDAAIGVIERICTDNDVAYFSCRGYTSVSEIHQAAQRIRWYIEAGEQVTVLHIGDHDPSGIDMTRDIEERLRLFISRDWAGLHMGFGSFTRGQIRTSMLQHMADKGNELPDAALPWRVQRIALNYDQVQRYNPPPNPAKTTDARFQAYFANTGLDDSWELDALDPIVLQDLIVDHIEAIRDEDIWADTVEALEHDRELLTKASDNWAGVVAHLEEEPDAS
jgi:hypothetical protein